MKKIKYIILFILIYNCALNKKKNNDIEINIVKSIVEKLNLENELEIKENTTLLINVNNPNTKRSYSIKNNILKNHQYQFEEINNLLILNISEGKTLINFTLTNFNKIKGRILGEITNHNQYKILSLEVFIRIEDW